MSTMTIQDIYNELHLIDEMESNFLITKKSESRRLHLNKLLYKQNTNKV